MITVETMLTLSTVLSVGVYFLDEKNPFSLSSSMYKQHLQIQFPNYF